MKNGCLLLLLIWGMGFVACQSKHLFYHIHNLPNGTWKQTDKVLFLVDVEEIITRPKLDLLLRLSPKIPADSLHLAITISHSVNKKPLALDNKEVLKLQTGVIFAQEFEQSTHKGWDNVVDLEIPLTLPNDFSFDQIGTYAIELKKVMPKDDLPLLRDIGLKISHK